jgi:hypothetical protein
MVSLESIFEEEDNEIINKNDRGNNNFVNSDKLKFKNNINILKK